MSSDSEKQQMRQRRPGSAQRQRRRRCRRSGAAAAALRSAAARAARIFDRQVMGSVFAAVRRRGAAARKEGSGSSERHAMSPGQLCRRCRQRLNAPASPVPPNVLPRMPEMPAARPIRPDAALPQALQRDSYARHSVEEEVGRSRLLPKCRQK